MSQQINLYRPIFRKQEKKFSAKAMLQAGAVLIAGIALLYAVLAWQVHSLRADARTIAQQYADAAARLEKVTRQFGPKQPTPALLQRVQLLESQVAARRRMHQALQAQAFPASHGYSDYLLAFARQDLPALWLTAFTITGAGEELELRGRTAEAVALPRFVQRLAAEPVFAGKEFEAFLLREQGRYADFRLSTRREIGAAGRNPGARP